MSNTNEPQKFKEQNINTESVKCVNCGSNLVFDPSTGRLKCPHCESFVDIDNQSAKEMDINIAFDEDDKWKDNEACFFKCNNCGAKVVLDKSETAKSCPFCGTAHVEEIKELTGIKPNAVLPFEIGTDKAIECYKQWAKRRFFAPSKFKKGVKAENVKGVYVPCFTFDSSTSSFYRGRIGEKRTRVVSSGKNTSVQTYIVWKNISGNFNYFFNDVLTTAGSKISQTKLDKISPFPTDYSKEYDGKYLLGYMAYHYDYSIKNCWETAKVIIDAQIKKKILAQYNCDVVDYINISTHHNEVKYKYVMLPVYVGNYKYNAKVYNFYINGSNGRVSGKTPKSILKILATVLLGLGVLALIILLIINYLK